MKTCRSKTLQGHVAAEISSRSDCCNSNLDGAQQGDQALRQRAMFDAVRLAACLRSRDRVADRMLIYTGVLLILF